ncbi:hypothetical protein EEB16_29650, partial [Rhodococcus sp. WS7]
MTANADAAPSNTTRPSRTSSDGAYVHVDPTTGSHTLDALSNATAESAAHNSYEDRPAPMNAKAPNAPITNTKPT